MSERLIDSVCPHCGRLGTTVRVVKHEDGFTKLSRLCKECGGEWIHTFDADWLAVAKMRRLEAEVERLTRERDEAHAEVARLKQEPELLRAELISLTNAARKALADAYDRGRNALEAKS